MIKIIQDFPNYSLSNDGVVTNLTTNKTKTPTLGKNGYFVVHLYKNNTCKREYVHRLLATHFLPNPENKRTVNHKDGDKTNNSLSNLEWNTDSENIKHAYENGIHSGNRAFTDDQYGYMLNHFLNGMSLTKLAEIEKVVTATVSENLKTYAERIGLSEEFSEQLIKQKAIRAAEAGKNKRKLIVLHMVCMSTNNVIKTFSSVTEAKEYLGKASSGPISNAISGRQKSAYGYYWKKLDLNDHPEKE